ncbi:MAG: hypothetical protein H6851_14940 [Geminicoccaceae bacterium]|nr:hypothetical protein [Geminicoccaceae bacterium]
MFYDFFDFQRRQWDTWLGLARQTGALPPLVAAQAELIRRSIGSSRHDAMTLEDAVRHDLAAPVEIQELASPSAFTRLLGFRRGRGQPRVLYVAPYSGYATSVSSALVASLGDVIVTDWVDARNVPLSDGPFGLDQQVRLVAGLVAGMDSSPILVGLSQSGPAVLAGCLLAHSQGCALPAGIILLGSPVDTRGSAGSIQLWLDMLPKGALENQVVATVSDRFPGAGRKVYPGLCQLMAYAAANPAGYFQTQAGLWGELMSGVSGPYERMHDDMHRLIDVPGELFCDMISRVLRRSELACGTMRVDGVTIDLRQLADVPLLTVEARMDELVGKGQTHALHELAATAERHDPARVRLDIDGGHEALFVGPDFVRDVVPTLQAFIAAIHPS